MILRVYDGTRYLVLFGSEKYDSIYDRIRYIIILYITYYSCIIYIISHNYAKIEVDSYDSLPLGKTMAFRNVIVLIKSVWNKYKSNYYYDIFLGKAFMNYPKNKF